jgi:hypothetical protein
MKYTVRFRSEEQEWKIIATFETFKDALAKFNEEIKQTEAWVANTTQVIDEDENVFVEMNPSLLKPQYSHKGVRLAGGRKPKGYKMVSIRMTEEEKVKVKEFLAQIRKEK